MKVIKQNDHIFQQDLSPRHLSKEKRQINFKRGCSTESLFNSSSIEHKPAALSPRHSPRENVTHLNLPTEMEILDNQVRGDLIVVSSPRNNNNKLKKAGSFYLQQHLLYALHLPSEIWELIFQNFNLLDIARISTVNREFHRIAFPMLSTIDVFQSRRVVNISGVLRSILNKSAGSARNYHLTKVIIDAYRVTFSDQTLVFKQLSKIPTIHTLKLVYFDAQSRHGAITAIQMNYLRRLKNLTSLDLTCSVNIADILKEVSHMTSLEKLYLKESSKKITEVLDSHIARLSSLTLLRRLQIDGFKKLTANALLPLTTLVNLRDLHIDDCEEATAGLGELAQTATSLRHLTFSEATKTSESVIGKIGHLTKLRSLTIRKAEFATNSGLRKLHRLRKLKSLTITAAPHLNDSSIALLIRHMPALQSLKIRWCTKIRALEKICAAAGSKLKELDIAGCYYLNMENELPHVVNYLTNLEMINISRVESFTDKSAKLLRKLKNLTHISLCSTNVTENGLEEFCSLKNLKSLNISNCSHVSAYNFFFWTDSWDMKLKQSIGPHLRILTEHPDPIDLADFLFRLRLQTSGL